jgi:pimeloyl-ACP methyl ester carboxylesterase
MEEQQTIINQLSINYKTFGLSTEGEVVLVLHGWGKGSDSWVEVGELLAQKGYQVIIPDLPGFGKSAAPDKPWTVNDYVEWVAKFAAELNLEIFTLIGHSFGGQVATKFAAFHQEKVGKLILCAAAIVRKPRLGSRQLLAKYLAKTKVIFQNIPFGIYPILRKIVYRIAGARDYSQLQGVMTQTFLNVVKESVITFAEKITTPTLIVWGEKDKETPLKDAYEISEAIKNSRLEIISGAGHKLHRTHSRELAKIINSFLI